jgi:hypothetical protein
MVTYLPFHSHTLPNLKTIIAPVKLVGRTVMSDVRLQGLCGLAKTGIFDLHGSVERIMKYTDLHIRAMPNANRKMWTYCYGPYQSFALSRSTRFNHVSDGLQEPSRGGGWVVVESKYRHGGRSISPL